MMDLTQFDKLLLALSLGGQILLLIVLLRARLYSTFPIFFTYVLYSSVSDLGFLLVFEHLSDSAYRLAYFANYVPEVLLQIGILFEVARNVLNPVRRSLPRNSLFVFAGMLGVGTLLALILSAHSRPDDLDRWSHYFVLIDFGVAVLRLAIFAAIAGFSQLLGIGWKNHVLQIATGFLSYSVAILLVALLHRFIDVTNNGVTNEALYHLHEQFRIIGWCMVLGYWSYTLSRAEAPRKEFSPKMAEFLVSIGQASRSNRTSLARWYRK